jgi:hypothetical protein
MTDSFWDWHNKAVQERGAARVILQHAGFEVTEFGSRADDPPDCEGMIDGLWSAVEVTRLSAREQIKKARKKRTQGMKLSEVYFEWDRDDLLSKVQALIEKKDKQVIEYKGGPYRRKVLLIHSDEFRLDRSAVTEWLKAATFRCNLLTDSAWFVT